MQLHQFRQSPFCLKVRLVLAAKGLSFDVIEVTPGVGQIGLFRLSGQRQVPVLVDGETVVTDSTAIALHLEAAHPEPPLLPADPIARARVLLVSVAGTLKDTLISAPSQVSAIIPGIKFPCRWELTSFPGLPSMASKPNTFFQDLLDQLPCRH